MLRSLQQITKSSSSRTLHFLSARPTLSRACAGWESRRSLTTTVDNKEEDDDENVDALNNEETNDKESNHQEDNANDNESGDDALTSEEDGAASEAEKYQEPSYEEKNPVSQGDTLYVRERREFQKQLSLLRKDFVIDPTVQEGKQRRRKELRGKKQRRRRNKYIVQSILRPPPELEEGLDEVKVIRKERHEMMTRVMKERHHLKQKYAALRQDKILEYRQMHKERENEMMKEMVLSGEYLTQMDQVDAWIDRKLSDTSHQLMPDFVKHEMWANWISLDDESRQCLDDGLDDDGEISDVGRYYNFKKDRDSDDEPGGGPGGNRQINRAK